jgi:D-inositol-3-phosphate glycosyltransferase
MKIAMLSVHSCPLGKLGEKNTGGMSVYIRELARELGRRGHLVDVYSRSHESVHDRIVEFGPNARIIHLKAGEDEEIHKLAIYPHLADFASELENFRRGNGLRYDLIHSHYWLSGWAGKWIQWWWDIPHITMFHTVGAVKNAIGIGEPEPELRINTEKELIKGCQRIISSTHREKEDLIRYYSASPEAISVIPCGVNLNLFKPIDKATALRHLGLNGEAIILFVGRIDPLKGVDKLLMAMAYLERPTLKLIVIGGDEGSRREVERLKRLSRHLEIHDSVVFHGLVKQDTLPHFYSAADLCVVPSYYESFGLVALESLACGTPVVATKVGCIESVIRPGETGYVVKDNAPRRLADKIALLLSGSNGRLGSREAIRATITRFRWSTIADAVVDQYREVTHHAC